MVSLWKILLLSEILLSLNLSKNKEMVKEKKEKEKSDNVKFIEAYRKFSFYERYTNTIRNLSYSEKTLMSKNMPYKMMKYKVT